MRKFLICFLLMSLLLTAGFAFAQKELEIEYPDVPGSPGPTSKSTIPDYVKYIFNFAIWASGFLALGVLVYGGFQYLTSTGNMEKIRDAKERIASALLGLLILFGSYLILVSINPQLVIFHIPSMYPTFSTLRHGVLICKEQADVTTAWNLQNEALDPKTPIERKRQIKEQLEPLLERIYEEQCYHVEGAGDIKKEFDKFGLLGGTHIQYIYLIPGKNKSYGAIIYEDKDFKGESEICPSTPGTNQLIEESIGTWKISSIRPFVFVELEPGSKAFLYKEVDFDFGGTAPGPPEPLSLIGVAIGGTESLLFVPQSIEIKGSYIVVLYTEKKYKGKSETFTEPGDYDLNNNLVACRQWCYWHKVPYRCTKSCVKSAFWTRGKLY